MKQMDKPVPSHDKLKVRNQSILSIRKEIINFGS